MPEYDADVPDHRRADGQPGHRRRAVQALGRAQAQRATSCSRNCRQKWNTIAGARVAAFQFPPLPGSQGLPVQFVITTTEPFENLNDGRAGRCCDKAQASGMFFFVDSDLKLDKPQSDGRRSIATRSPRSGMTQQDVGAALGAALGGGYVNYFSIAGRSYKVIPQVLQVDRLNPSQVLDYYIRTPDGSADSGVDGGAASKYERRARVDQPLPAAEFGDDLRRDSPARVAEARCSTSCARRSREVAPSRLPGRLLRASRASSCRSPAASSSRCCSPSIIVFLALAAQFESFRDPIVILVSVPMALFGALIFINLGLATLNIYTQVGLVTLMGLISKHGILIVQFANELQRAGKTKREAIEEAAGIRLRPILMTTAAMVLGVVPLVIASGAGAAGRHAMGLVIFTGLSIGTLFTLFVVPAVYMLLGADHHLQKQEDAAAGLAPSSA